MPSCAGKAARNLGFAKERHILVSNGDLHMTDNELFDIVQRFAAADCSWLTTVRPDGRPHSAPVWHVWAQGKAYVVTKQTAVKVANIRHQADVVLTHPDPHAVIIIDGEAQIVEGMVERLQPLFQAKYDWDIAADGDYDTIIAVAPNKLLAWGEEGAAYRKRWTGKQLRSIDPTANISFARELQLFEEGFAVDGHKENEGAEGG
jgi:hypothetical protein